MLKEKHRRRFHHYVSQTGPSYIRKDTIAYDSCEAYTIRLGWETPQTRKTWEEGMARLNNSHIFNEDPFGVNDYAVNFSLNKKMRWEINREIAGRIEEVQDPDRNLRVSASVHTQDVSKCGYFFGGGTARDLGCSEYHTVSRDGTVTHRQSGNRSGRTRLRRFSHPTPRPYRSAGTGTRRWRENRNWAEDSDFPVEKGSRFQKAHVHYTTHLLTSLPSKHNKESHRSFNVSICINHHKETKWARRTDFQDESGGFCRCMIHDLLDYDDRIYDDMHEEDWDEEWDEEDWEEEVEEEEAVEEEEEEDVDEEDKAEYDVIYLHPVLTPGFAWIERWSYVRRPQPIVVEDLAALVVQKNRKNRKRK